MSFLGIGSSSSNLPSEFKDPFKKENVDKIEIELHNRKSNIFREGKTHKAVVHFSNGNTKGKQEFFDNSPQELFKRIQSFVDKL